MLMVDIITTPSSIFRFLQHDSRTSDDISSFVKEAGASSGFAFGEYIHHRLHEFDCREYTKLLYLYRHRVISPVHRANNNDNERPTYILTKY